MGAVRAAGLEVGRDIAIVGYNDVSIATDLPVPLTTIRSPMFQMGQEAARMLLERLVGRPRVHATGPLTVLSAAVPVPNVCVPAAQYQKGSADHSRHRKSWRPAEKFANHPHPAGFLTIFARRRGAASVSVTHRWGGAVPYPTDCRGLVCPFRRAPAARPSRRPSRTRVRP